MTGHFLEVFLVLLKVTESLEECMNSKVPSSTSLTQAPSPATPSSCVLFISCQVIFGEPSDGVVLPSCRATRRAFQVFSRRDCGRFIREAAGMYSCSCVQVWGTNI